MYVPISFKSDYSLLKSLLKIKDIVEYAKSKGSEYVGILDDNPYAIMDFYNECEKNGLKCICGMVVRIGDNKIYLYIENYEGYQNLIKINELMQDGKLTLNELFKYNEGLKCVLPYENNNLNNRLSPAFQVYLGYKNESELKNVSQISKNVLFINEVLSFKKEDVGLLKVLYRIGGDTYEGTDNYVLEASEFDSRTVEEFIKSIDLHFDFDSRYIPKFCPTSEESSKLLYTLSFKGLEKRLGGKVTKEYKDRLSYELDVINKMGFVDYFLIVYDYVKFAKKNDIYVGPGRGSAAGALVSYTLGITEIDPLKYDLLFERFLNPERITMPDIDLDFEDVSRSKVIDYVKGKYGESRVGLIVSYGTLTSRQVVRDVGKVLKIDDFKIEKLSKSLDAKKSLKDNLKNEEVLQYIKDNDLTKMYKISMKLEGLKKHTTIHAAGVVISSIPLINLIPTFKTNDGILTGYTMEYLEKLGLLKMDFLSVQNLTILHRTVDIIKRKYPEFNLKNIPLDDAKTYKLLSSGNTDNIFQFETAGMRNLLRKLQPENFDDITAAVALFRPGPMENIGEYIARRKGEKKVAYLHPDLIPILKSTYGIIIYQEQIMQILVLMGGYTFAEADLVRRAMSKKKKDVMESEREKFISNSVNKGYQLEVAKRVYDLIVKFANYGFNKSHSVAYALIGYQMAYLKANYIDMFQVNTLNMNLKSNGKIKDVIDEAKGRGLDIVKPDVNISSEVYKIENGKLILPLTAIKGVAREQSKTIINAQPYDDFFDFFKKVYNRGVNKTVIELLIRGGAFDSLGHSRNTMLKNIDSACTYVELVETLDESLIMKPVMEESNVEDEEINELDVFGFYISLHPSSKIEDKNIVKIKNARAYLNKRIKVAVLVDSVKVITTKKGDKMAFLILSDDTGVVQGVIFPKNNELIEKLDTENVNILNCFVADRSDDVQLVIEEIVTKKVHTL